jgi:HEAT repeat protein
MSEKRTKSGKTRSSFLAKYTMAVGSDIWPTGRSGAFIWCGLVVLLVVFAPTLAQTQPQEPDKEAQTREYWGDLMHYTLIGKWEPAQEYGKALLALEPDPLLMLQLAESDQYGHHYRNLGLMEKNAPQALKDLAIEVLKLVEKGRYMRRTDSERIAVEVKRLSSGTTRARMLALQRLKDSGEWAVPIMIEALRDPDRSEEISLISWAMPQLGQPAINPLVAVLGQSRELNIRLVVLDALQKIGYEHALPYIQQVIEDPQSSLELKNAAINAYRAIDRQNSVLVIPAAMLFEQLAESYYNHLPSLEVPANQEKASVWFWNDQNGLFVEQVPRGVFDELMTMRCCELSVGLDSTRTDAISLWLSAFFRLEAEGHVQPGYFGPLHPDAATYALTMGPEYLHRVLARALENQNRPVALAAIHTLQRNAGQQSLLYELAASQPLIKAMSFPDREVRFSAALAVGGVLPHKNFEHSETVVPILAEALRQKGQFCALAVIANQDQRNNLATSLRDSEAFADVIADERFPVAIERAQRAPSLDMVVLSHDIEHPNLEEVLKIMQKDYRLAFCPTLILSDPSSLTSLGELQEKYPFVAVMLENSPPGTAKQLASEIMERNNAKFFESDLADKYAIAAAEVLHRLALTENTVLPLKAAEPPLIEALYEQRPQIQHNAVETLARMDSAEAQRAIANLALDETAEMPIRLSALENLTVSAKKHGHLLLSEQVDAIYNRIIISLDVDSELRTRAAQAYGSLNLPSPRISQLILSQGKSDSQ